MYGKYDVPFRIEEEGITVSIERRGEHYYYSRACLEENTEKRLLMNKCDILIYPVEPLNTPKVLSQYLFIEFDNTLILAPKVTKKIFLTFPVEIAVFLRVGKSFRVIDSFSVSKQKFTLYGEPKDGLICKYWKSQVYDTFPSTPRYYEGVLELNLSNLSADWKQVTKTVVNAYGMKVFYNEQRVGIKARMKVEDDGTATTEFPDYPLERGMKKALETFPARKLSMTNPNFIMEYGL